MGRVAFGTCAISSPGDLFLLSLLPHLCFSSGHSWASSRPTASQYLVFRPERSESPGADFSNQGKLRHGGGIETRILACEVPELPSKEINIYTVKPCLRFLSLGAARVLGRVCNPTCRGPAALIEELSVASRTSKQVEMRQVPRMRIFLVPGNID